MYVVCHSVAPSATEPSTNAGGTDRSASTEMLVMVGSTMTPSTIDAASTDRPGPPRWSRMRGTSSATPMNP